MLKSGVPRTETKGEVTRNVEWSQSERKSKKEQCLVCLFVLVSFLFVADPFCNGKMEKEEGREGGREERRKGNKGALSNESSVANHGHHAIVTAFRLRYSNRYGSAVDHVVGKVHATLLVNEERRGRRPGLDKNLLSLVDIRRLVMYTSRCTDNRDLGHMQGPRLQRHQGHRMARTHTRLLTTKKTHIRRVPLYHIQQTPEKKHPH